MKRLDPYPRLPADPTQRERKLVDLFRDIAETVNELARRTMPIAVHSPAVTADTLVKTGQCIYRGYHINVVTATGTIDIRDGTSAGGGTVLETIPIATAVGTRREYSVGVACDNGIYVDFNGGATGTVIVLYEV